MPMPTNNGLSAIGVSLQLRLPEVADRFLIQRIRVEPELPGSLDLGDVDDLDRVQLGGRRLRQQMREILTLPTQRIALSAITHRTLTDDDEGSMETVICHFW